MKWMGRRIFVAGAWLLAALALSVAAAEKSELEKSKEESTQALLIQVRQRLQKAPVLRGKFEQLKTLQGFKKPLRSTGDFVVAQGGASGKDQGILWHVTQPFPSALVVKPGGLQSMGVDGQSRTPMHAGDEPVLRTVNAMLLAVISADVEQLQQFFSIAGSSSAGDWKLQLTPRDAMLAQWLKQIQLQGAQFVQQVELHEARGDVTRIRIWDVRTDKALSDMEAAQLR